MYNIENKDIFLGRVQKLLGVPVTKRMDERTRLAIVSYRKSHELGDEPIIDKELFYSLLFDSKYPTHPFEALGFGSCSDDVYRLNSMLSFFIKYLGLYIRPPRGEYFTRETQNALDEVKKHFSCVKNDSMFYWILEYSFATIKSSILL